MFRFLVCGAGSVDMVKPETDWAVSADEVPTAESAMLLHSVERTVTTVRLQLGAQSTLVLSLMNAGFPTK